MSKIVCKWAAEQKVRGMAARQVYLHLASWAGPDGFCRYRSVRDIAGALGCSARTVQRALDRLEASVAYDGLGLIERVPRFLANGAQRANGFILVGYPSGLESGDKLSGYPCQIAGGGRDQSVTPDSDKDSGKDSSPLSPPSASRARRAMPVGWQVPAATALPKWAHAMASQWPEDVYAGHAEAFQQQAVGSGLRRADWDATWAAHVQKLHEEVMRAVKAGGPSVAHTGAVKVMAQLPRAVAAQASEDAQSARLREALQQGQSPSTWQRYFAPCAFLFRAPGLQVIAPTLFVRDWLETNATARLRAAGRQIVPDLAWVMFEVQPPAAASVSIKCGGPE